MGESGGERGGGATPILWRLLTTKPTMHFTEACAVIAAYTRRWRIEELHKAWKSAVCGVEDSWLREREHFYKWATRLSAVAARAERLNFLARTEPQGVARNEFTRDEIAAVIIRRKPKGVALGATPTIGQRTRWIADIRGYIGKSSGGPPGSIVIGRGLERIAIVVDTIASLRNYPDKSDECSALPGHSADDKSPTFTLRRVPRADL